MKNKKKGFTLVELIVVLVIIIVLAAILIPTVTRYLEKGSEATDATNIRTQYLNVMSEAISSDENINVNGELLGKIQLKQRIDDWQDKSFKNNVDGNWEIEGNITEPQAGGTAWVECKAGKLTVHYGEGSNGTNSNKVPVPGDQATKDAANFAKDSAEYKILSSLAEAERQALEEYKNSGRTTPAGYSVKFNEDGSFSLNFTANAQLFHEKSPSTILKEGYMVAVKDGKVGSNLSYNPETKKLKGTPYHIYVNQWHNDTEGINYDY